MRSLRAMVASNCSARTCSSITPPRFTDRSVSNSLARQRRSGNERTTMLESYAAGSWFRASDEGEPLLDASTGEEITRISSRGLDLGAMVHHAHNTGGPALRGLTFH